ncbi:gastrin-releasing peptide receptor-like [Hydra vulgaris]|uniref:Gastrin-releasing peptide receptor-like n=1 Tax=Hydra vulgaris TaxID=6087 RepID=A0ABM4DFM7_HYDVU
MIEGATSDSSFKFQTWEVIWYGGITIFGVVGNLVVMVVVLLAKEIKKSSTFNILIFSLAAVDFILSTSSLGIYILTTNAYKHPEGKLGNWLCKTFTGSLTTFWMMDASTFLLVYIAFERQKAVVQPLSLLKNQSIKCTAFRISLLLLAALLLHFIPRSISMKYTPTNSSQGNACSYTFSNNIKVLVHLITFVTDTLVPLTLLIICFQRTSSSIKKAASFICNSNFTKGAMQFNENFLLERQKKTMKTMRIVLLAFIVCILPNRFMYFLSIFSVDFDVNSNVYQVFELLRVSNSFVNPIIYSLQSKVFRKNFCSIFYDKKRRKITLKKCNFVQLL